MNTESFFPCPRPVAVAIAVAALSLASAVTSLDAATLEEQISESPAFPEPLLWVGSQAPTQTESQDLFNIATNFPSATWKQDLLGYIANHASSPWTPAVRANLAIICRQRGEFTGALQQFDAAWQAAASYTNDSGKVVGDTVRAHWSQLLSSLGRTNELAPLLSGCAGRCFDKVHLQELWQASIEAYSTMAAYPELSYRCGTFALINVAKALQMTNAAIGTLKDEPSTGPGFSMTQLASFAQQRGMGLAAVVRTNATNLVVPSVIHWSQNHYAAITATNNGAFWVKDPTFGNGLWMTLATINAEASGKFLVPSNQVPAGWRLMTQQETDATWGQGLPNNVEDWKDAGCDQSPGGRGAPAKGPCPPCADGMPRWWVSEPYINLWLADEPLSYRLSDGQKFAFRLTYKQRYSTPLNQTLLPTIAARSTNTVWEHNFLSHIQYWDPHFETIYPNLNGYTKFQNWTAMLFLPGGTIELYSSNSFANDVTASDARRRTRVESLGNFGYTGFPTNNYYYPSPTNVLAGFRVVYPDDSQDWYTLTFPRAGVGGSGAALTRSEALLTMKFDPSGRMTRLCYEGYPSGFDPKFVRVKHVIDPDGRTNTFYYDTAFPRQVTQIVDPYGSNTVLTLFANAPNVPALLRGMVGAITDVEGNGTHFFYNQQNTNSLIASMLTPYGTTTFVPYQVTLADAQGNLGGHNRVNRSMAVEEPNGARHLFLYRYDSPSKLAESLPTNQVPAVNPSLLLDNGAAPNNTNKAQLTFRNSFYWGPRDYPLFNIYAGSDTNALTSLSSNDFRHARWRHWLDSPVDEATVVSDRISIERAPSPGGSEDGQLTWFSYQRKLAGHRIGSTTWGGSYGDEHQLALIAKVLPDGSTHYDEISYAPGALFPASPFPRELRSTYTKADGTAGIRTNIYVYANNRIDLTQVYGADGDLEETYIYNTNHQVLTYSNAIGEAYTFGYDAATRHLTSVSTPAGLNVSLGYYPGNATNPANANMLETVVEQPINRTNRFTYVNGLPNLHTNELGLRLAYTWDRLNRLTRLDYLDDGTFMSNGYYRLDLVVRKDRLGNNTFFQYDAAQRLTAVTNANTNITRLAWCGCGALEGVTNALSQSTSFTYDQQSRLTYVLHPDQSSLVHHYDPLGRLTHIIDGAGHALTLSYNNQGLLATASNAFGRVLSFVYDREDRPAQITDAEGVTVTNTFDNLNRITNRAWSDNTKASSVYGFGGTNITSFTPLGHTNRTVLDAALRLIWSTNANFEVTRLAYNPANEIVSLIDGKNQTTTWNYDRFGRATNKIDALAREVFRLTYDPLDRATNRWTPAKGNTGYAFDPVGNLKSVTYSNTSPLTLSYAYDAADRLTNMVDAVGGTRFTYTAAGQLDSEDGPWSSDTVSRSYIEGQRTSLTLQQPLASSWSQTYGYDASRRLQSLTSPAGSFVYDYAGSSPASALIHKLTLPNGALVTNAFDSLAQLTNTTLFNQWHSPVDAYGYAYDASSRRTNVARTFGMARSTLTLAYDAIGQLKIATGYETNGTARLSEKFGYAYDAANNLQQRTNATLTQTFAPDAANQLGTVTRSGSLTVAGYVTRPVTNATVNDQPAALYADQTYATTAGLTATNGNNSFTVIARTATGLSATNTRVAYLPSTTTFVYDANGNLMSDGLRAFIYDGENQLTNVTVTNVWRSEFQYDGLNRRRVRREYTWSAGAWSLTNETHYVYDGHLVLQERDGNNIPVLAYTRGLDLSGSLQAAGGIGGLLALSDQRASATSPTNYYYHADGSGNITALINQKNEIVARYLYDPFGNLLANFGPMADLNRYQFSSKELHANSGLSYYGLRYYDPNLQRWLNQDPMGEAGGINLYRFVENSPTTGVDAFGWEVKANFNMANGVVSVTDLDTGVKASASAFSGNGPDANNPNSEGKRDSGPVPRGDYDILDHPIKDWFSLDGPDRIRDDYDPERRRGKFRLHLGTASDGCITVKDDRSPKDYHGNPNALRDPNSPNAKNWDRIRDILKNTKTSKITDAHKKRRIKYGTLTVVYEP